MTETRHQRMLRLEEEARQQARGLGFEAVTPAAARALWGKSPVTVREAAREGRIETWEVARIAGRDVRLYRLSSCVAYWGEPDPALLADMRAHSMTMYVQDRGGTWCILHPEPIVTIDGSHTGTSLGGD